MFWTTHGCVPSNLCQVISKFFKFSKKEALISHRTSSQIVLLPLNWNKI